MTKQRLNTIANIIVAVLFFYSQVLLAQGYGKITGKIIDASTKEPLPFANVILENTQLGAASDVDGKFIMIKIPSGIYSVSAQFVGYNKTTIKDVEVLTDLTSQLTIELQPASIQLSGEVIIIADKNLVRRDITSTESRISARDIEKLPVQEVSQLIDLQAGITRDSDGGLHIRGGRTTEISYLINGISITDDYSRSQSVRVETNSIQELQVISGSFNAEYGNALSGVINYVTKTGSNKTSGNLELWTGDYISNNKNIFWGIDKINPIANYNIIGSLNGPIVEEVFTYFLSLRKYYNDGWIYGINKYQPQGRVVFTPTAIVENPGDNKYVSMSYEDVWSGQISLEYKPITSLNIKTDLFGSKTDSRFYNHIYRLNPKGDKNNLNTSISLFPKIIHTINNTLFHEFSFAYRFNDVVSKLYDKYNDPRYVHPDSFNVAGFTFYRAGTNLNRFERRMNSFIAKWDLTSQLNSIHLIKLGLEFQTDKVRYENINLQSLKNANGQEVYPFKPFISGIETSNHDLFQRNPIKFAAYIQDKIELESLIINVGLRFDLFDAKGKIPLDQSDPNVYNPLRLNHTYKDLNNDGDIGIDEQVETNKYSLSEREKFWWKSSTSKKSVSPRFGLAYSISDQGTFRFSYGIFQQIPEYSQLYQSDQLKLTNSQGIQGPFGNPDLKPQLTTIYEIGFKQMLSENIAIDVTGFYRDIRNWISTSAPIPTVLAATSYSIAINKDFANVKGITLAITKRFTNNFSFDVDYTYQIAEGTNSTPDEEFFSFQNGDEPKKQMTPLNWDQTHTLNSSLYIGYEDWGISLTSKFNTGQPYTPTSIAGTFTGRNIITGLTQNSRRKPIIFNVDVEGYKSFMIGQNEIQVILRIFNLFDSINPTTVFGDTGEPDYTLQEGQAFNYDDGWFTYPNYYSQPRSIYLGTKIKFDF